MTQLPRRRSRTSSDEIFETVGWIRRHAVALLMTEIVFAMLAAVVVLPLLGWMFASLVDASGDFVISNNDLIGFALSPRVIVTLLAILAVRLATRFVQVGAVTLILTGSARGWFEALLVLGRRLVALAELGAMQAGLFAAVGAVALTGVGCAVLLLTDHDINYYLAQRPPRFWVAAAIAGVSAVVGGIGLVLVHAATLAAVPVLLLEGLRPRASLVRSSGLFRQAPGRLLLRLGVWAAAVLVVAAAAAVVVELLEVALLSVVGHSLFFIVLTVSMLLVVRFVAASVLGMCAFAAHVTIALRMYGELTGRSVVGTGRVVERARPAGWSRRYVALGALATLLAVSGVVAGVLVSRYRIEDRSTLVIAHRGSPLAAPENTIPAIEAAIAEGADIVEIDVQLTRDDAVVLVHDADLLRIADDPRRVAELTLPELQQIDVGSWFGPEFAGTRVPTLEDAMRTASGRMGLLIELKPSGAEEGRLAERVADLLRDVGFDGPVQVMSLVAREVHRFQALAPHVPVGLTVGASAGDLARLGVDFVALSAGRLRYDRIDRIRDAGKDVYVWTLNDDAGFLRYLSYGVDGIITDTAERAVEVRDQRRGMSEAERALLAFRYRLR